MKLLISNMPMSPGMCYHETINTCQELSVFIRSYHGYSSNYYFAFKRREDIKKNKHSHIFICKGKGETVRYTLFLYDANNKTGEYMYTFIFFIDLLLYMKYLLLFYVFTTVLRIVFCFI